MRVLVVYAYLTVGGVETVLRARMEGLAELGIRLDGWFLRDHGGWSVFAGLNDHVRVGSTTELARALAHQHYDRVVSIDTPEALPTLAAAAGGPPLVVECHSPYLEHLGYLEHLATQRPAAVFVPSHYQARLVEMLMEPRGSGTNVAPQVPVRVVPNPLHPAILAPMVDLGPAQTPVFPIVLWLGRLDDLKNWRGFFELGRELRHLAPAAELWLVGRPASPGEDAVVRDYALETGVLPRLRWLRGLPHQRVPALLDLVRASGGVLVSTSRGESFGMTVAEAMARGCAVATPDTPPFDEFVVDGETGLLFAPEEPVAAAKATAQLLEDAALRTRVGTAGRELMSTRHAPAVALRALADELRALG